MGAESVHGMIVRCVGPMICKGRPGLFGGDGVDGLRLGSRRTVGM
ncbi:MAG TPA: hypothetical protein VMV98_08555 [Acidobacteriaceae bacterium]|nr:hypothetical protein [Acidobacteriaceae bacterium]